jgi:hypothetical protein
LAEQLSGTAYGDTLMRTEMAVDWRSHSAYPAMPRFWFLTMTATVFAGNIALSDIHCGTTRTIT